MLTVTNQEEMYRQLDKRLNKTYDKLREYQDLPKRKPMLKTYIVESNVKPLEQFPKVNGFSFKYTRMGESCLFSASYINANGESGEFYIDTTNERFWKFHTISRSDISDDFLDKAIMVPGSKLDYPWLTSQFLERMSKNDEFRGFTVRYDDQFVHGDDESPLDSISLRLWGTNAPKVMALLKNEDSLKHSIAISGVGLKRYTGDEEFAIDDLTYLGKFTARGTSIHSHNSITDEVLEKYAKIIDKIEGVAIQLTPAASGHRLDGESFTIHLQKPIMSMSLFVTVLLSSKYPFRLWGISKELEHSFVKVNAVDLHTGSKLDIEISPNWLRIFLPKDSCGNAITRLCTNIQHHYDSEAVLTVGENERII